MVKVFTDGDVEVYDGQGNLRVSLHGQHQQVLTATATGIELKEVNVKGFGQKLAESIKELSAQRIRFKEGGAEVSISPGKIESARFNPAICPLTLRGPECGKEQHSRNDCK